MRTRPGVARWSLRRARSSHRASFGGVEPQQVGDVRLGAEAPAAHADAVLVAEHRGDVVRGRALDRERTRRRAVGRVRGRGRSGRTPSPPGRARGRASACRVQRRLRGRRCGPQPISSRIDVAAANAMAPSTFGVPASSRSGRSAQTTSSRVTASTVPPPEWSGVARERVARADERARAERRVQLVRRQRDEVEVTGIVVGAHVDRAVRRRVGRRRPGCGRPTACTFSASRWTGGSTPVTFDAPDTASSATRPACSREQPVEVVDVERAVGAGADADGPAPGAPPRQVVRVVLEQRSSAPPRRRRSAAIGRAC